MKERGFLTLLRVRVTERSLSWAEKHPASLIVPAVGSDTEQDPVANEAAVSAGDSALTVEGN